MSNLDAALIARELRSAQEKGEMVNTLPSSVPGFDLDAAYAVESTLKRWREQGGHKAAGRKVGYANKAMWRVLKLETLVWGHMYEDTIHRAGGGSISVSIPHPRSLKVEPEIMFGLKQTLAAEAVEPASALAAVEWMAIGFEVIDCPYPEWKFQPGDFIASYGLHAALAVGEPVPVAAERIPALLDELTRFKVRVSKNGGFVEEGSARSVLRSPALCLAELASAVVRRFPSEPLAAGEVISTGTITAGHLATAGDRWTVDVEGLALPSLTLQLT